MKSNIRKLRKERKISQTKLAEILGKTQQSVSHMERDRDRISIESLITMSDYFGVSTDYILDIGSVNETSVGERLRSADMGTFAEDVEKLRKDLPGQSKKTIYQLVLSLLWFSLNDDSPETL